MRVAGAWSRPCIASRQVRVLASRRSRSASRASVFRLPSLGVPKQRTSRSAEALRAGAVQLFVERARAADTLRADDPNASTVARSAVASTAFRWRSRWRRRARRCSASRGSRAAGRPLPAAHRRQPHRAAAPADAARDARLELRPAVRARAQGAATACDLRRRLHARGAGRVGGRRRDRRVRGDRSTVAPRRAFARRRGYRRERRHALSAARDDARLCAGKARRGGRVGRTERRHATFFRDPFDRAYGDWYTMPDVDWCNTYLPERDNLRNALDWTFGPHGDTAMGIEIAGTSHDMWSQLSLIAEGRSGWRGWHRVSTNR